MHYAIPISQRLKKFIKSLHQKQFRDENSLFVAEGEILVGELLESGYQPELLVVRESSPSNIIGLADSYSERGIPVYLAPKHQFEQLCDTKSPQGIIALVNYKEQTKYPKDSFIVLDGVADPGNLGTIIRTADWFGIRQIILGNDAVDGFNPKTVRASMGSIFRVSILTADNFTEYFKKNFKSVKLFGASLDADNTIDKIKAPKQYGLVFGNEAKGISEEMASLISEKFKIEGKGSAESLNVAVSVGISLYNFTLGKK